MAHIVIMGAGIGGMSAAYEMQENVRANDKVTVISSSENFSFTPSNPWVAVNWRTKEDIQFPIAPYFERKNIGFIATPAKRVHPEKNQVELTDGRFIDYDYLMITTGPRLAFEEVEGLGPDHNTHSICTTEHAVEAGKDWESFVKDPGPIICGAAPMASCFGPAYEFAFIMDTDLRKRKIRNKVPITYVTPEPYHRPPRPGGRGRLQGPARIRHARAPHQMDHQRQGH